MSRMQKASALIPDAFFFLMLFLQFMSEYTKKRKERRHLPPSSGVKRGVMC